MPFDIFVIYTLLKISFR